MFSRIVNKKILLFVVSFFISFSSIAYAIDYGSGLYGSGVYSVTESREKSSSGSGFYNNQQSANITTVTPPIL